MGTIDLDIARRDAGLNVDQLAAIAGVSRDVVLDAVAGSAPFDVRRELFVHVRRHLVERLMRAVPDPSDLAVARQFVGLSVEERIEAWRSRAAFAASTSAA